MQLLKVIMRRLNNYRMDNEEKTIEQIVESMRKSMVGYEVLGTPEGRLWRLKEIAACLLAKIKNN